MKIKRNISQSLAELGYSTEQITVVLKEIAKIKNSCDLNKKNKIQESIRNGAPLLTSYPDQLISSKEPSIIALGHFIDKYFPNLPVYILPCWETTGDGGFAIKNFKKSRSSVGTTINLINFFRSRQGCLDMVFSNVSVDHKYVKNQLKFPKTNKGFVAELIILNPNKIPKSHRGHSGVTKFNSKFGDRWLWTTFSPNQANINYSSPKALIWLLKSIAFYLNLGVSSIRLDAVPFTWTNENGPVLHAPQCHSIIKIVRGFIDYFKPGTLLIAQSDYGLKSVHDYIGNQNNEAHLLYRHELAPILIHAIISKKKLYFEKWIANLVRDSDCNWISFLSTWDGLFLRPWEYPLPTEAIQMLVDACVSEGGIVQNYHWENNPPATLCATTYSLLHYGVSHADTIKRITLAHAMLLALPGVPALYFNSLLGMKNWTDWQNFDNEPRSIVRERYSEKLMNQLISLPDSPQNQLYKSIKPLIDTRIKHPAIGQQSHVALIKNTSEAILAWSTYNKDKIVSCYFNIGDKTKEIQMTHNSRNILGVPIINGRIKLPPFSYSWVDDSK